MMMLPPCKFMMMLLHLGNQDLGSGQFVGLPNAESFSQEQEKKFPKLPVDYFIPPIEDPLALEEYMNNTLTAELIYPISLFPQVLILVDKKLPATTKQCSSTAVYEERCSKDVVCCQYDYLTKFMGKVNYIYEKLTNPKLQFVIADIILKKTFDIKKMPNADGLDAEETLKEMAIYWHRRRQNHDPDFDIAILLSGEKEICIGSCDPKNLVNGMAVQNGTCFYDPSGKHGHYYGMAVVKDDGEFSGVRSAAHELAHLLGAKHYKNSNDCCPKNKYLMKDSKDEIEKHKTHSKNNERLWSHCSLCLSDIQYFLKSFQAANCLYDNPAKVFQQCRSETPSFVATTATVANGKVSIMIMKIPYKTDLSGFNLYRRCGL